MSRPELRKHPAQTRCLKTANMAGTQSQWLHVEEETLVNAAAPNYMARPEGLNKHEITKVLRQTGVPKKAYMRSGRYKSSRVLRKALKKYMSFAVITASAAKAYIIEGRCPSTSEIIRDLTAIPWEWPSPPYPRWQSEQRHARMTCRHSKNENPPPRGVCVRSLT